MISVRGEGLLLAAVLNGLWASQACRRALGAGLVCNAPAADVLRFAPSLLVSDSEIDQAVALLSGVLAATLADTSADRVGDRVADGDSADRTLS